SVCYSEFSMRHAESYATAYFWLKLTLLFPLALSFLFHFCLIFSKISKNKSKKILFPLIYIPTGILICLDFATPLILVGPQKKNWGWTYLYQENSFLLNLYLLWVILLPVLSIILCVRCYYITTDHRKKLQAKYFSIGLFFSLIIYLIFDFVLAVIFESDIPEFGTTSFTLTSILIGYAIWKYKLFKLDPISVVVNVARNLSDAVILTTITDKIKAVNQITLKLFEYQEHELINNPVNILFSEENNKIFSNKEQLLEKSEIENVKPAIETFLKTKMGKKIPVSLSISFIRDKEGESHGIVYLMRDITERKILENKLKKALEEQKLHIDNIIKASQFKTNFLSSMSHDLRTPLNAIIGFSDLLLDESYGNLNEDQIDFLSDIKSSSDHLLELIDHILDISKIESGELKLNLQNFELNALIDEIKSVVKPLYSKKSLYFQVEGLNEPKSIYADLVRLKEIFYNLLSNAIKYTIKGGITLQIMEDNNRWKFNVIDTGIGIAKENYELIFKEYKRVESLYVSSTLGTGLGLTLAKKLVNLHGGEMYFTSKLGEGSTFTFTIPKNLIQ
ncbi:MAG: PAS domain S-box protein, partial [Candidatus Lokiarchaeota archaeon]|nr:PAS domain S-box protein [Candidatus Lokiarchaeota archaeon]